MIEDFARALNRQLQEEIDARAEVLVHGTESREKDERKRGEVMGLRLAQDELKILLDKARRRDNEE
jgi:hypothetical protein